jgi:hypothetical protein
MLEAATALAKEKLTQEAGVSEHFAELSVADLNTKEGFCAAVRDIFEGARSKTDDRIIAICSLAGLNVPSYEAFLEVSRPGGTTAREVLELVSTSFCAGRGAAPIKYKPERKRIVA